MTCGETYHIYNHANGNENLFLEEENYRYFLQQCRKYVIPIADMYAYCLLPNHFHFLMQMKGGLSVPENKTVEVYLSKQFSNFFNSYTKSFNTRIKRRGSLFEKNFERRQVTSPEQWQRTFLYINLNAQKHNMGDYRQWKWCSYSAFLHLDKPSVVARDAALEYFGSFENILYCMEQKKEDLLNEEWG